MKLLIVSDLSPFALANSYIRAIENNFPEIELYKFDTVAEQKKYIKLGKFGDYFHRFVPIEAWIRKLNRELAVYIKKIQPDVLFVFGNSPVTYSTYAFAKSIFNLKTVLYWPDTLTNLEQNQLNIAPFMDILTTYSSTTEQSFQTIGYKKTFFFPFAYDNFYMGNNHNKNSNYTYDISFIGGWRPEREAVLSKIANEYDNLKISIRGPYWDRDVVNTGLKKFITPKPLYGKDFADFFRHSKININIIDPTNYPAANMRFFEIPGSGGLQLASACPEMENEYTDKKHLLYFNDENDVCEKIDWILNNKNQADTIRENGYHLTHSKHTYTHRVKELLTILETV